MAVDVFKLQGRVEIDTGKAESDLKRVGKAAQQTQHALTQTDTAGKKAGTGISSGFNQGTASAHKLSGAIGQVQSKLGSLKMPSLNFGGGGGGGLGSLVGSLTKANILTNAISSAFSGMTDAMKEGYSAGIEYNSMLEKAQISFTTLLGSSAKATAALKELQAFGEATPFEFPDLIKAEQKMLAFGFSAESIIPTLRSVGDAVSAVGGGKEELNGVVKALGDMKTKGKVSAEEMNQLAEHGIGGWDLLAQKVGMTKAQLMKLAEQGKISGGVASDLIVKAMGEKYGGQMSKMSGTREGQMSNLQDIMNRRLGEATSGAFGQEKQAIEAATKGLGTQSADRFVKELNNTVTGIAAGITESMGMVSSGKIFTAGTAGLKLADKAQGAASGITDRLEGAGVYSPLGILKKTFDPSKEKNESMRGFFQVLQDGINGALEKLAASGSENGKEVGTAIGTGIKTGTATALDAHSPSRVMMKLGEDAAAGFVIGFEAGKGNIKPITAEDLYRKQYEKADKAGYDDSFKKAAQKYNIPENILMGIASRESNMRNIVGDNGNGLSLMQIDKRAHPEFAKSDAWKTNPDAAIDKGASVLAGNIKWLKSMAGKETSVTSSAGQTYKFIVPKLDEKELMRTAIAMYNSGGFAAYHVSKGRSPDFGTTGKDYSADVLNRSGYFEKFMGGIASAPSLYERAAAAYDAAAAKLSSLTEQAKAFVGIGGATVTAPAVRAVPQAQSPAVKPQAVQPQPQTVQGGALGSATATAKADTLTLSADATAAGNAVMKQIPQMTVKTVEAGTAATQTAAAMGTVTKASQEEIKALFDVGEATQQAIDHMAHFRDAFANSFDDLLDGKKFDWKSLAKGFQSSMISSLTGGKATTPGQMLSGALFGYGGSGAGAQGGGSGGGGLLSGLFNSGGGGGGSVPATGGFAGGGGANDILGKGMNFASMFQKGGALSKLPGLGKVGGLLGKIPGMAKLGSLFGFGGGGGAAAGAAGAAGAGGAAGGGGFLSALMPGLMSNPFTAVAGIALAVGVPLLGKLFAKNPLNDYKRLAKGEYGVSISDQMASKIMQIGQSKFGQEWKKRQIETVRLPEVRDMLSEYAGAFQKGGNSKLFDSRIYSDAFSSVNQFKVGMINGGRVPGPTRGFDHVPVMMDGGELVISNDQQRRAQRGRGGMFGKGIEEILARLAASMDRFEAMPADHVVMTGLAKRPGMAAADVRQDFERRGEHSTRIREISGVGR